MGSVPRDDSGVPLANVAEQGIIAPYEGNVTTTTANDEIVFRWGENGNTTVYHVIIQNRTTKTIYFSHDAPAMLALDAGQSWIADWETTQLHIYAIEVVSLNPAPGDVGIVIQGSI